MGARTGVDPTETTTTKGPPMRTNETAAEHLARATIGRSPEAVAAAVARQAARRGGTSGAGQMSLDTTRRVLALGTAMRAMQAAGEALPLLTEADIEFLSRPGAAPEAMLRSKLTQQRRAMAAHGSVTMGASPVARPASSALIGTGPLTTALRAIVLAPATGTANGAAQRWR